MASRASSAWAVPAPAPASPEMTFFSGAAVDPVVAWPATGWCRPAMRRTTTQRAPRGHAAPFSAGPYSAGVRPGDTRRPGRVMHGLATVAVIITPSTPETDARWAFHIGGRTVPSSRAAAPQPIVIVSERSGPATPNDAFEFFVEIVSQLFHADMLITEQAERMHARNVASARAVPPGPPENSVAALSVEREPRRCRRAGRRAGRDRQVRPALGRGGSVGEAAVCALCVWGRPRHGCWAGAARGSR